MVIHFSILAVILFVSLLCERRMRTFAVACVNNGDRFKTRSWPWLLVFGYLAFLAAMRTNANDTSVYIHSFQNLEPTWDAFRAQVSSAGSGKDWAFDAVSILFKILISDDYHLWLAMYAAIESLLFVYILRRYAVSLLDCCFFLFCSSLYYNYFSMMRQWFAVVILFAASQLIKEKKFLKYLLLCLLVAQFHASAYFMIIVYFLANGKPWSVKHVILIAIFAICMLFLNPILNGMEEVLTDTTYDYAIEAMNSNEGSSLIRAFIAAVPVLLAFLHRYEIKGSMINICVNMSLLNLLLNILASFTSGLYIIRFATYMSVFNLILYPYLLNVAIKGNNRKILKPAFYIIYLILYIYQMKHQGAFFYGSDILGVFA